MVQNCGLFGLPLSTLSLPLPELRARFMILSLDNKLFSYFPVVICYNLNKIQFKNTSGRSSFAAIRMKKFRELLQIFSQILLKIKKVI
jgi:hypothetical protein